jgi:hypothetical protein
MYTLITLGTPHIGYMYNKSRIIDTGTIAKLKNHRAVDHEEMEEVPKSNSTHTGRLKTTRGYVSLQTKQIGGNQN